MNSRSPGGACRPGSKAPGAPLTCPLYSRPLRPQILIQREHIAGIHGFAALSPETERQVLDFVDIDPGIMIGTGYFRVHRHEGMEHRLFKCLAVSRRERLALSPGKSGLE